MRKKPDIIDLAIYQVGREGNLGRDDWLLLVIDRMITIRDKTLHSEAMKSRSSKRWK